MDYFSTWRIRQVEKTLYFEMPKKPEISAADQALRESIGAAIRMACASRSRKPADVALAGGVSLAHQYRIESGERTADALYLVKVARYLNTTVDELIRPESQNLGSATKEKSQTRIHIGVMHGNQIDAPGEGVTIQGHTYYASAPPPDPSKKPGKP